MKKRYTLIFAVLLVSIIVSCSKGEAYFKYKKIDNGEWYSNSKLEFVVDSSLFIPSQRYDIQLDIIYSSVYPYHDLWMSISHNLADTTFVEDTLKVTLIDEYGKMLGSGNTGVYQLSLPYKSDVKLDSIYTYSVNVGHIMSDRILKGIEKIGLKISESGMNGSGISNVIDGL